MEETASFEDFLASKSPLFFSNQNQHFNSGLLIFKMQTFSQLPEAKQISKRRLFNALH